MHTAIRHFWETCSSSHKTLDHRHPSDPRHDQHLMKEHQIRPHIITTNIEHDATKLPMEHLAEEGKLGEFTLKDVILSYA